MNLYHLDKYHLKNIGWLASFGLVVSLTGVFSILELNNGAAVKQNQHIIQEESQPNEQILGAKDSNIDSSIRSYNFSNIKAVNLPFNLTFDLKTDLKVKKIASGDIFYLHESNSNNQLEDSAIIVEVYEGNSFKSRENIVYSDIEYKQIAGNPGREYSKVEQNLQTESIYPAWFSAPHAGIEIRASEDSRLFYVFSFNPKFKNLVYNDIIQSLEVWE